MATISNLPLLPPFTTLRQWSLPPPFFLLPFWPHNSLPPHNPFFHSHASKVGGRGGGRQGRKFALKSLERRENRRGGEKQSTFLHEDRQVSTKSKSCQRNSTLTKYFDGREKNHTRTLDSTSNSVRGHYTTNCASVRVLWDLDIGTHVH